MPHAKWRPFFSDSISYVRHGWGLSADSRSHARCGGDGFGALSLHAHSDMRPRGVPFILFILIVGFYYQFVKLSRSVYWENGILFSRRDPRGVDYTMVPMSLENTAEVTTMMPNSTGESTISFISAAEIYETCPETPPLLCKYFTEALKMTDDLLMTFFNDIFFNSVKLCAFL